MSINPADANPADIHAPSGSFSPVNDVFNQPEFAQSITVLGWENDETQQGGNIYLQNAARYRTAISFSSGATGNKTITIPNDTGTLTLTKNVVTSFNGSTGAVVFSSYVASFNGITGAVTGVTAGGANTFTQLNSFSAGISAASGVTFSADITVNSHQIGRGAGNSDTNIVIGRLALGAGSTGTNVTAVGVQAADQNSGTDVVAIGYQAGYSNDSNGVVFVGSGAGSSQIGVQSIFIGGNAGTSNNSTGSVGIGFNACASNLGNNTVAIGAAAGAANKVGGVYLTAIGSNAGYGNEGYGVVAIGGIALSNACSGNRNTAIGSNAMDAASSAANNTSIGAHSLTELTTGSGTVAVGGYAGQILTTGSNNCIIGFEADVGATADSNSIVIGKGAVGLGTNTTVIGNSSTTSTKIFGILNLPSGLSAAGATFSGNISAPNIVNSFNGSTGAVTFSSYVTSFNGITGAVTGVTAGGANTFTALQTFSAGISAAGGVVKLKGGTGDSYIEIVGNTISIGDVDGNFGNGKIVFDTTEYVIVNGKLKPDQLAWEADGSILIPGSPSGHPIYIRRGDDSDPIVYTYPFYVSLGGAVTAFSLTTDDVTATNSVIAPYLYTDSIAPTNGTPGTVSINCDSGGLGGGSSITQIGDIAGETNNTFITVDDSAGNITVSAPNGTVDLSGVVKANSQVVSTNARGWFL